MVRKNRIQIDDNWRFQFEEDPAEAVVLPDILERTGHDGAGNVCRFGTLPARYGLV